MKTANFNSRWMEDPLFKDWLLPCPESKDRFKCNRCNVSLCFSKEGRTALVKHARSKKHTRSFSIASSSTDVCDLVGGGLATNEIERLYEAGVVRLCDAAENSSLFSQPLPSSFLVRSANS